MQPADLQNADRRGDPHALPDAIGSDRRAGHDQRQQQNHRWPGQQNAEEADCAMGDRCGGDCDGCGDDQTGEQRQRLATEAVLHVDHRAGRFGKAAGEFGIAKPGHGGRDAGKQERDRRGIAGTRHHRADCDVDASADDDAEAIEQQRPERRTRRRPGAASLTCCAGAVRHGVGATSDARVR